MLEFLKLGGALRSSRNIVGGVTGFIFSLGNIFNVPLIGKWPATLMVSLGLSTFILKVRENYQMRYTTMSTKAYQEKQIHTYSLLVAELLNKDPQKLPRLLQHQSILIDAQQVVVVVDSQQISPQELSETQQNTRDSDITLALLNDMLIKNINRRLDNKETIARKHIYCTAFLLIQIGSHFMECLLLKAYDNPDLFMLNEITPDNVFIGLLALIALYNGIQAYKEENRASEQHIVDIVCEQFVSKFRV